MEGSACVLLVEGPHLRAEGLGLLSELLLICEQPVDEPEMALGDQLRRLLGLLQARLESEASMLTLSEQLAVLTLDLRA